jgi:hypothetical protein
MGMSRRWFFKYSFVLKVFTGPVSWCAKKPSTIAVSAAEAEYFGLSYAFRKQFG